jgi:hypothetical protein
VSTIAGRIESPIPGVGELCGSVGEGGVGDVAGETLGAPELVGVASAVAVRDGGGVGVSVAGSGPPIGPPPHAAMHNDNAASAVRGRNRERG